MKPKYFVFDLDDTLAHEIDYLKSAYRAIARHLGGGSDLYEEMFADYQNGVNVFQKLSDRYQITVDELLEMYRHGMPEITLRDGALDMLMKIKDRGHLLGLITDGRSKTQRNKILALGISDFFDKIIISEEIGTEKPHENNFKAFQTPQVSEYFYIADNTKKDFVTPNRLGWITICLLDVGQNIHRQDFTLAKEYLPEHKIQSLHELEKFI